MLPSRHALDKGPAWDRKTLKGGLQLPGQLAGRVPYGALPFDVVSDNLRLLGRQAEVRAELGNGEKGEIDKRIVAFPIVTDIDPDEVLRDEALVVREALQDPPNGNSSCVKGNRIPSSTSKKATAYEQRSRKREMMTVCC